MGGINPDSVDEVIDNLAEQKDLAIKVADTLGTVYNYNNDELLQKLDDMMKLPNVHQSQMVNAPIEKPPINLFTTVGNLSTHL